MYRHHAHIEGQQRFEVILGGHVEWFVMQGSRWFLLSCFELTRAQYDIWKADEIWQAGCQHATLITQPIEHALDRRDPPFLFLPENVPVFCQRQSVVHSVMAVSQAHIAVVGAWSDRVRFHQ